MKRRFTIYREVIEAVQLAKQTKSLYIAKLQVNILYVIHEIHKERIKKLVEIGDFSDVNGIDFNVYAYDTLEEIKKGYMMAKEVYFDLHYQKKGFNSYNV